MDECVGQSGFWGGEEPGVLDSVFIIVTKAKTDFAVTPSFTHSGIKDWSLSVQPSCVCIFRTYYLPKLILPQETLTPVRPLPQRWHVLCCFLSL